MRHVHFTFVSGQIHESITGAHELVAVDAGDVRRDAEHDQGEPACISILFNQSKLHCFL